MNIDSIKSSSMSSRNTRYAILCKVKENLQNNISVKQINEQVFSGGNPLFVKMGKNLGYLARRAMRGIRGPITTGQYSERMPNLQPLKPNKLISALPQLAKGVLKKAIFNPINMPSARGTVPTDVLKGMNIGRATQIGYNVNKLINPKPKPEAQTTTPQPAIPQPATKPTMVGARQNIISTPEQRRNEIKSLESEIARRSGTQIDLLPALLRNSQIRKLQAAQKRLKDLSSTSTNPYDLA